MKLSPRLKVICTVTNDLNQDQRMQRICTSLVYDGYDVTLIGRLKPSSAELESQNYHQQRLKCWFNRGFLFYLEYNFRLFVLLYDNKQMPFILYTVDSDTLLAGGILKYMKGIKQIFDAHEYFTEVPELSSKPIVRRVWNVIEHIFIPKADEHITVGSHLADIFSKKFGKIFIPIFNVPVSKDLQPLCNIADPPMILYQGMLNQGRGLKQMIAAMEKIDRADLYIMGEGDISSELRLFAAHSPASKRIHFLGWKSHSEMDIITPKATLAVNLLENSSQSYYYSLANKFFDYMHACVPSINMAFPEYIGIINSFKVGVMIESLDQELIAATINELLENMEKMEEMREACRKAKQIYNWEYESKKLIEIFDQLNSG